MAATYNNIVLLWRSARRMESGSYFPTHFLASYRERPRKRKGHSRVDTAPPAKIV